MTSGTNPLKTSTTSTKNPAPAFSPTAKLARLKKIADYLLTQVTDEQFNATIGMSIEFAGVKKTGTIGFLPAIFPAHIVTDHVGNPIFRRGGCGCADCIREFLGLTPEMAELIFAPDSYAAKGDITRRDVADRIMSLIGE